MFNEGCWNNLDGSKGLIFGFLKLFIRGGIKCQETIQRIDWQKVETRKNNTGHLNAERLTNRADPDSAKC